MNAAMKWEFGADGESNFWTILDGKQHWLGKLQLNGEFLLEKQEAIISMMTAAPVVLAALRLAEAFMSGFEDDNLQEGIGEKLASIRAAVAKAEGRADPAAGSFWDRFDKLKADTLATEDGKSFAAAGFEFFHNGGGCTAWRKPLSDGRYIMITDAEGSNHSLEGDGDSYLVGFYASEEDVDGIVSDAHATAESVIGAAMHFAIMDQWEIAGRRAGWRTGDAAGQLLKNIAGASTANVFKGDWKALCEALGIEPEATKPAIQMEHFEVGFGVPDDVESPTGEIARILRAVADDVEQNGIPQTALYDSKGRFVGEVKISEAE